MNRLLFSILLLLLFKNVILNPRVNVDILYESLCPDSLKFITEQLYPAWKDISPFVNLKLIPFGKSSSLEDRESFVCQHGPKECMGNRIQSCALSAVQDSNAQVEFVNCFMVLFKKGHLNEEYGQTCASRIGLDWDYVSDCYESNKGTSLQLLAEEATTSIKPSFIPTILYNGEFNQELQDESLVNFKRVVCSFITQIYATPC